MTQPSLFDQTPPPAPPPAPKRAPDVTRRRHGGNAASEAANARVAPHKGQQRDAVVLHLAKYPVNGCTSKQITQQTGIGYTSISGRLSELRADGLMEPTGERLDGCALVRLTNAGRLYAEGLGR